MQSTQTLDRFKAESLLINKNKLISYFTKQPTAGLKTNELGEISDKVILNFIAAFLYLFCALEAADWNIYSAAEANNDLIVDNSFWNIESLNPFTKKVKQL